MVLRKLGGYIKLSITSAKGEFHMALYCLLLHVIYLPEINECVINSSQGVENKTDLWDMYSLHDSHEGEEVAIVTTL